MSLKLQTLIPLATALFLIGCSNGGGGGGNSSSTPATGTTVSFTGVVVDGYISEATVCLDTNVNAKCDSGEPTTMTTSDGTFSFTNVKVPSAKLVPVIVTGGTDTATGKAFVGELKHIVDVKNITNSSYVYVTPLTDLVATSFIDSSSQSVSTITQANADVARALGLSEADINADPMKDKNLFAKTQELQQIKELMLTASVKATGSTDTNPLAKKITTAIVHSIQGNGNELDTTEAISSLNTLDSSIVIPVNEKEFVSKQIDEIKNSLQKMVNDDTIDTTALNTHQSKLEERVEVASSNLKNATAGETITVVTDLTPIIVDIPTPPAPPSL